MHMHDIRETAREAERNARNQNNQGAAFALCCLQCLLGMIERLMEIFNLYAFTQGMSWPSYTAESRL